VMPGSKIYTAPSPLTAGTVPVVAADGLTGLTAEYPHSPERLAARIGSSKLLTAAMIESRPLAEVRKALAPDRKPVAGVTPMKEEDPVAVSRMHRIAGYTLGGEQFARTVSHQNFRSHVEASTLHDDHFWYQHQAKKWEQFQQSQRMKRIQSAADVKKPSSNPKRREEVEYPTNNEIWECTTKWERSRSSKEQKVRQLWPGRIIVSFLPCCPLSCGVLPCSTLMHVFGVACPWCGCQARLSSGPIFESNRRCSCTCGRWSLLS
jgi:hypothetical protein